jgi:hypothetical protein
MSRTATAVRTVLGSDSPAREVAVGSWMRPPRRLPEVQLKNTVAAQMADNRTLVRLYVRPMEPNDDLRVLFPAFHIVLLRNDVFRTLHGLTLQETTHCPPKVRHLLKLHRRGRVRRILFPEGNPSPAHY